MCFRTFRRFVSQFIFLLLYVAWARRPSLRASHLRSLSRLEQGRIQIRNHQMLQFSWHARSACVISRSSLRAAASDIRVPRCPCARAQPLPHNLCRPVMQSTRVNGWLGVQGRKAGVDVMPSVCCRCRFLQRQKKPSFCSMRRVEHDKYQLE